MTEIKNIALKDLHNNTGFEIESGRVKANPRVIRDAQYKNLLQSLRESNMTDIMPLKVFEHDGKYIVIGGNMRLRALRELKAESVDCILIPQTYTADMLNKAIIIDNSTHGDWDMDMLANEWNAEQLNVWGIDLPEYKDPNRLLDEADFESLNEVARGATNLQQVTFLFSKEQAEQVNAYIKENGKPKLIQQIVDICQKLEVK